MAELTPMMKQYLEIKKNNPDSILFFRLGDFYEMFSDDARTASRELDLTLTTRDKDPKKAPEEKMPMCGIPYHASESYIARLIAKGYKVAICEQMEDPATTKGLVKRDIIRVVTPGTVIDAACLEDKANNFICGIYADSRGAGVAFCDISTGKAHLTAFTGKDAIGHVVNELGRFHPAEAILNDGAFAEAVLVDTLRKYYKIPEEWSEEVARRVIGLRYELDLRGTIQSLSSYVFLSDVSDESLSAIMELSIPGMKVEASTVREYNTKYAAHILGYVGRMSSAQWEEYKGNPDYSMDSEIGQAGFEAAFEKYLHGVDAWRIDEITADGTVVDSYYLDDTPPKAGANVEVAIDIGLQSEAESKLELLLNEMRASEKEDADGKDAEGGAVVAIDVRTGQVLVCASYPTYDPTNFFKDYEEILKAPYNPLYNRALNAAYPPGSTYKMSMVISAIHEKYIDSDDTIYAKGVYTEYEEADFMPKCLLYINNGMIHENLTASEALMVSCNYFFYDLADHLRMSVIDSTAKSLGLGESTGIELPENTGHRANEETKKKLYATDNGWYAADQILAGIGQSDNKFTPMQLCVYASTLANQGTRYRATFLNRVVSADYRELLYENEKEVLSYMEISDEAFLAYKQGMIWVAHHERGTAYKTFGKDYPITIAAKTGTAETGLNIGSDNGAFICFAPADNPRIAIAVYGERAGHGSSMAAVAKAILDVYFEVGEAGDVNVYENQLS